MDAYETAYNMRHEEANAATITSHARDALKDETIRRKNETRKEARERKIERREEEKRKKAEEIKRLKQIKRDEVLEKVKEMSQIGALELDQAAIDRIKKELETDFVPDVYDKTMQKTYNEKYYEDYQDQEVEIDPNLNVALFSDHESDADFEQLQHQTLKQKSVEQAN